MLNGCRDDNRLGCTEPEDAENRERQRVCIQRHHGAVRCLRTLQAAGLMRKTE